MVYSKQCSIMKQWLWKLCVTYDSLLRSRLTGLTLLFTTEITRLVVESGTGRSLEIRDNFGQAQHSRQYITQPNWKFLCRVGTKAQWFIKVFEYL